MNAMQLAVRDHLWTGLREMGPIEFLYRRGVDEELTIDGVKAGNTQTLTTPDGFTVSIFDDDFLMLAEDLCFDGVPSLPKRHDRIIWEDEHGTIHEFDVGIDGADRHYRYSDPHRTILRIHTTEKKLA